MKKLSLKNLKLEANDMLQRNQLKTVLAGGYNNSYCHLSCYDGYETIVAACSTQVTPICQPHGGTFNCWCS